MGGGGRREGRGATGLGGAAADSLTSGNRNLSQAYTTSSTAPRAHHGRVHLQTPLPSLAAPTAHTAPQGAGVSWLGSAQPDAGVFSICPQSTARLAGSQQPSSSSPQPWSPGPPFPGSPRTAGAEPCGAAPASRHCRYSWSSRTRAVRGQVLPQTGQQNGHSGPWAGSCVREASRTRHFPARPHSLWSPDAPGTLLTRRASSSSVPLLGTAQPRALGRAQVVIPELPAPQSTWDVPPCPSVSCCPHAPLCAETRRGG